MSIVARGLARGLAAGFIVAVGLGLGSAPIEPPEPPTPPATSSPFAPGAMAVAPDYAELERHRIKRQNEAILAVVAAAVTSRILE